MSAPGTGATNVLRVLVDASMGAFADAAPTINRFTIETVVGDIAGHVSGGSGDAILNVGIAVSIRDANAGSYVFRDPATAADGDLSWLWKRTFHCTLPASPIQAASDRDEPLVRVKVRRVLRPQEFLGLFFTWQGFPATNITSTFTFVHYLRTLISRVA